MTTAEQNEFDTESLIGRPARVSVIHNEYNGTTYANIGLICYALVQKNMIPEMSAEFNRPGGSQGAFPIMVQYLLPAGLRGIVVAGLLSINQAWTTDTDTQAREIALRQCPAPFDLLSIRAYSSSEDIPRIANYARAAAESRKALFVGEFGVNTAVSQNPQSDYNQFLAACRVAPLVAMWDYDRTGDAANDGMNATLTNSRSWMLTALLPATFSAWARGWAPSDKPGGSGQTAFEQYAFGAPVPGASSVPANSALGGNALTREAIVRTNDPALSILGETSNSLATGSWTSNGVSVVTAPDQAGVLPGCERRRFSVPAAPETKKFLRLRAVSP